MGGWHDAGKLGSGLIEAAQAWLKFPLAGAGLPVRAEARLGP